MRPADCYGTGQSALENSNYAESCIDILDKNAILIDTLLYLNEVNSGNHISSLFPVNLLLEVVRPLAGILPISFILILLNLLLLGLLIIA